MCFSKKKERKNKTVSFLGGIVSHSSSPGRATGEERFLFFLPCFFLSLPPHVLCYNQNRMPPAPPYDEKTEKSCPASDAPIGHLS
jgi:hypothetical protein